ncbi:MAG: bifunctional 5,10-methylenetetrahydrofolate dehydrogenase/5,10-methenyltetrahydrofolate cyclohydrolase [Lachnospiraceae bacterium]|nr:bifunctional 5,10-methylenetetrahydrofolate dehydrogenase/5,10-methenyltetrahydrofolate cyclohydrolase [Lachnospiraceae bacterium]
MAQILKGAPVAAALDVETEKRAAALREKGVVPTLAILRAGEREDEIAYERGAVKRCAKVGVEARCVTLPADVPAEEFYRTLEDLNRDPQVHGILMLCPLPAHLDQEKARKMMAPAKDVDGCTDLALSGVFTGSALGFPPCTASSALEILRYYGVDPKGKRAVVIGRSLVIGRPVALMLLQANATVTICHTKTVDIPSITRQADILISASGAMESIGAEHLREGQTVIDVGISWNEEKQKLCGDVRFEEAEPIVAGITPVPGGVGSVTTAVLAGHVVQAAERTLA